MRDDGSAQIALPFAMLAAGQGGFQQMLQSQKRFEYNADFWEMRWGMKELAEGDTVMVSFPHLAKWLSVFSGLK